MAPGAVLEPHDEAVVLAAWPLNPAYLHSARLEVEKQSPAVPGVNPGLLPIVPLFRYSRSSAPAAQEASAAVCADCRRNHRLERSTAKAADPNRKMPRIRIRKIEAWPDSPGRRLISPDRHAFLFFIATSWPNTRFVRQRRSSLCSPARPN